MAAIMHDSFASILGDSSSTNWSFSLNDLYRDDLGWDPNPLIVPFSEAETYTALRQMDRNSAPDPDGFGPGFYQAAWSTIAPSIHHMLQSFHGGWLTWNG